MFPSFNHQPPAPSEQQRLLRTARWLARLLDARWGLGPIRFGAETVLDFIPGVGDVASAVVSAFQVLVALRVALPRQALLRMLVNIAIDLLLGLVPLAGDLADSVFKVHVRNQRIIDGYVYGD